MSPRRFYLLMQFLYFFFISGTPSSAECLGLLWKSIPDAFFSFEELERALQAGLSSKTLQDVYDFYSLAIGTLHTHTEPRSLKHLSRSTIRRILCKNACWIPDGIKLTEASDYYHTGSDVKYLNYDDCSTSSVAENIGNAGSGKVNIKYGNCNPSSVAYTVYSYGSGDIYLTFGDTSSVNVPSNGQSGDKWASNIYNQGSGALYINYKNCCSSTSISAQNLYNQGSGDLDVDYGTCSSSKSRLAQNVYNRGSGDMRIVYRSCRNSNAVRTVNLVGSGNVIITYENCRSSSSNYPQVNDQGSGKVTVNCNK
ncbi:unnamed protein product [Larinioides sclopetarius]|uniref:Uncharacterized protein n=1 Tax=Larinioides sclopetarius TaxID=280406 RepID=A0AAV1ZJ65_9ARAC